MQPPEQHEHDLLCGEGCADDGGSDRDAMGRVLADTVHPTKREAVVSQMRLILEYAKSQLLPQNSGWPEGTWR